MPLARGCILENAGAMGTAAISGTIVVIGGWRGILADVEIRIERAIVSAIERDAQFVCRRRCAQHMVRRRITRAELPFESSDSDGRISHCWEGAAIGRGVRSQMLADEGAIVEDVGVETGVRGQAVGAVAA